MELSRLEIKGFKSFADKITVHFNQGITGVVGPNGCGKSNIVDAIRWVLGEQKTRNLRSEKMEDVVFNGTRKRKATQLAEVSLTFNNTKNILPTEYSQVTITRRYFRSGDSEYLLNGVKCRLKDINTLFMDTGIGPDSYSIIELEMVKDILRDTNDARRILFEEAAGISKFKKRKKETLSKLKGTLDDLDRVEDLLFEIEKQMKSLERQAKKAEKYYDLQAEYKQLSLRLAQVSIAGLLEKEQRLKKEAEKVQDEQTALKTNITEKEAAIEEFRNQIGQKEQLLRSRQKHLNEFEEGIRKRENEKQLKNERLKLLKDREEGLRNQLDRDRQKMVDLEGEERQLSEKAEQTQQALEQSQQRLDTQKTDLDALRWDRKEKEEALQQMEQELRQREQKLYEDRKQLEIAQVQYKALQSEQEKTSDDTSSGEDNLSEFDQKLQALNQEIEQQEKQVAQLEEEQVQKSEELEQLEIQQKDLEEDLNKKNRRLDALRNEYDLAKSLVENLEGFPDAVKFVAKHKDLEDKVTLLSDVFSCAESIRPALENILEPYINYFVVPDRETALQAIARLDASQKGRGNFFVLSALNGQHQGEAPQGKAGRRLMDMLEYKPMYQPLAEHLLGHVYLVEDREALPDMENRLSYLTKDGRVIQHGESLHGGSIGLFEGKRVGRSKNLERLEKEIKTLREERGQAQVQKEKLEQRQKKLRESLPKKELDAQRRDLDRKRSEREVLKSRREQIHQMLLQSKEREKERLEKQEELKSTMDRLRPEIEELEGSFDQKQKAAEEKRQLFTEVKAKEDEQSQAYNQLNIEFHKAQNTTEAARREAEYARKDMAAVQQRIEDNKRNLEKANQNINEIMQSSTVSDDELVELYEERDNIRKGVSEAEQAFYDTRGEVEERESELRKLRSNLENMRDLASEAQNKMNECRLELTAVRERIKVEFNIDHVEPAEESEEEDESQIRQKADKAKQRMDKMGPINPTAMEAYEEIKERYDFIKGQKDDLIEAKESLEDTILEIDTTAKENFLQTFEQVKANFIEVFRTLFTEEDEADLILLDPENPLESKIEIMAKPKGKRPQSVNQLSGGEKTLTATSLLFSIYLTKPAPFCIFDEVDAPLDDANIDKFNKIIRQFSEESQFIIVTHNKRTMAHTDVIYGVTMQEQGVSTVIPVDLRDLN